jgi:hypothetical protein
LTTYRLDGVRYSGNKIPNALFGRQYGFGFADQGIQLYAKQNGKYDFSYHGQWYLLTKNSPRNSTEAIIICLLSYRLSKPNAWDKPKYTPVATLIIREENLYDATFGEKLHKLSEDVFTNVCAQLKPIEKTPSAKTESTDKDLTLSRNLPNYVTMTCTLGLNAHWRIEGKNADRANQILKPETFSI